MAPSSRDDQPDASVSRKPDSEDAGEREEPLRQPRRAARESEPLDFGAFVSRSVRSSSDRLRQSGDERRDDAAPGRARRAEEPSPERRPPSGQRARSRRYWRDSLREHTGEEIETAPTGSRRFLGDRDEHPEPEEVAAGGGGIGGFWRRFGGGGDGEGPDRPLIAWFIGGLVVMLLVILLLIRLLGGRGEEVPSATPPPSPTSTVVSQPGLEPASTRGSTPPSEAPPPSAPTETPEIRRGGDNRLGGASGTPASESQDITLMPLVESPLAKECSDRCLVRVETDEIEQVMIETGNRPSFLVNGLAWVVATPDQISLLDERADVAFVEDSDETLYLYVIKAPDGGDTDLVKNYGKILDTADRYYLVRFDELPARISTLANKRFDVTKVAPPPVASSQATGTMPIGEVSPGELMGQVSDANVVEIIRSLQASGSNDGTGIGSRYYTLGGNQVAADYLYQTLESFGLEVWFEDFMTPEGILLVNVVAEAPGRDDSAVYAVMAHLDSINEESSRATAPGADDNATGMAATLEMARILAQYELDHPVRFVFVNAEEVGILGATAWAKQANRENVPIEGVFNIDSVGSARQGRLLIFNSDERSAWMQDLMISVNNGYGLGQEIMSRKNPMIVADDNMVREEGIEAVMIARELYGWSPVHHSPRDVDDKVSVENVLTTTYLVLLSVAALVGQ